MKDQYEPLEQEREELVSKPQKDVSRRRPWQALLIALLVAFTLAGAAAYFTRQSMTKPVVAGKQGAGLLFVYNNQFLLLRRNSQHNNNTWGLPGGNVEQLDLDLLQTATRESTEEMGQLPEFEVLTEIKTRRGKKQQKQYSVFICNLQIAFEPTLNGEHSAYRWIDTGSISGLGKLHPVVDIILSEPHVKELAAAVHTDPEILALGKKPKKLGAGLFFVSEGQALLLTRNSSHNNATLSVPGGNVDLGEKHLVETAEREAVEEMGSCPDYQYKGEIDTRRGKHNEKEFKIFLAAVSPETKASFKATLDHESLDWGWYPLDDLAKLDSHPVVEILVHQHMPEIKAAFGLN